MKKRIVEVEESNEVATLALTRTKAAIRRLRLEYAILIERLEQRASESVFDPEEMSPPPSPKILDDDLSSNTLRQNRNGATKRGTRKAGSRTAGSTNSIGGGLSSTLSATGSSAAAHKIRDPELPKRPTNAYLIFCEMEKDRIREELDKNPSAMSDLSKTITEAWNNLDEEKRSPYYRLYQDDRERYHREMSAYNQKKEDSEEPVVKKQKIVLRIKEPLQKIEGSSTLPSEVEDVTENDLKLGDDEVDEDEALNGEQAEVGADAEEDSVNSPALVVKPEAGVAREEVGP